METARSRHALKILAATVIMIQMGLDIEYLATVIMHAACAMLCA